MNEGIEPFFFGATNQRLFGNYHASISSAHSSTAVLLCQSIGDEYIRAHRACRQLAIRLTKVGFPVLRFDYSGGGDSEGDEQDSSLERWLADIGTAADVLRQKSGVQRIILAGMRLGGMLAVLAATRRNDIAGLALWEPVISGETYLSELEDWHEQKMMHFLSNVKLSEGSGMTEYLGFVFSPTLQTGLRAASLLSISHCPVSKVLLIESQNNPQVEDFKAHLEMLNIHPDYQQVDSPRIWREDPDKALVPHPTLQAIVAWIQGSKS